MEAGTVIILLLVGLAFYIASIYNRLVTLKNRFQNSFSQIEVQLKRRYDLIPNLVETAKAYLQHERQTLQAVIQARNQAASLLQQVAATPGDAAAMQQLASAEGSLQSALGRLNLVVEAYPELKANQNMLQLSEELVTTENRVAFARQAFNDSVTVYNIYRQSFPPNFFASAFGHNKDASLLQFKDSAAIQNPPNVSF